MSSPKRLTPTFLQNYMDRVAADTNYVARYKNRSSAYDDYACVSFEATAGNALVIGERIKQTTVSWMDEMGWTYFTINPRSGFPGTWVVTLQSGPSIKSTGVPF